MAHAPQSHLIQPVDMQLQWYSAVGGLGSRPFSCATAGKSGSSSSGWFLALSFLPTHLWPKLGFSGPHGLERLLTTRLNEYFTVLGPSRMIVQSWLKS